jgi:hypothetical protein
MIRVHDPRSGAAPWRVRISTPRNERAAVFARNNAAAAETIARIELARHPRRRAFITSPDGTPEKELL